MLTNILIDLKKNRTEVLIKEANLLSKSVK